MGTARTLSAKNLVFSFCVCSMMASTRCHVSGWSCSACSSRSAAARWNVHPPTDRPSVSCNPPPSPLPFQAALPALEHGTIVDRNRHTRRERSVHSYVSTVAHGRNLPTSLTRCGPHRSWHRPAPPKVCDKAASGWLQACHRARVDPCDVCAAAASPPPPNSEAPLKPNPRGGPVAK